MSRTAEGPMEFSWQNGKGPVDENSPFLTAVGRQSANNPLLHKRPRSEFESPNKSFSTSNVPSLRPAANQTTLFPRSPSSPDKPLPPPPSQTIDIEAFRTPRRAPAFDFTSGDDTTPQEDSIKRGVGGFSFDSPDADSEATPDPRIQRYRGMGGSPSKGSQEERRERRPSPKKRSSLLGRLFNSPSTKRDKMIGPYSNKAEKRVTKRRTEKSRSRSHKHNTYDSDTDLEQIDAVKKDKEPGGVHGTLKNFLSLVENHPNAPRILINYLQLMTNFLFFLFGAYVLISLWRGILGDVSNDVDEATSKAILTLQGCRKDWEIFQCGGSNPPERTRVLCEDLAKCIAKNPDKVSRAQLSAKTFAKIINDFAEPISLKAMTFYLTAFTISWMVMNASWNGLRNTLTPDYFQNQHYPPPATPSRQASAGALQYGTPYHPSVGYYGNAYGGPGGSFQGMMPVENGQPDGNMSPDRRMIEGNR
ncbi:hypothetical protein BT63DRAFT_430102 [Microthyrium microscopicum]|uniref:Brl1/Brr6 domain-containing protein n=1 Tax=Microthyrium microscopicum TaxID=703497 RepID=A0A6A6TWJ5_9PEZI|nr:hypothetical protein BT63DRAFT_430102 [Microthyrium microscopicum]